jgi:hypothetical protein
MFWTPEQAVASGVREGIVGTCVSIQHWDDERPPELWHEWCNHAHGGSVGRGIEAEFLAGYPRFANRRLPIVTPPAQLMFCFDETTQ